MSYNLAFFRHQVERVIATAPTPISVFRDTYESDGYGGRRVTQENNLIGRFEKTLFDNSSMPDVTFAVSPGGRKPSQPSIRVFMLWEPDLDIRRDDRVRNETSGLNYRVTAVNDILDQHILLEIKLEMRD